MLIYEKGTGANRHLYGSTSNVPTEADQPLVYKQNGTSSEVTPALTDGFFDGGSANKVQRIYDKTLNTNISVYIDGQTTPIIGDAPAPKVAATKTAKKATKEEVVEEEK